MGNDGSRYFGASEFDEEACKARAGAGIAALFCARLLSYASCNPSVLWVSQGHSPWTTALKPTLRASPAILACRPNRILFRFVFCFMSSIEFQIYFAIEMESGCSN